MAGSIGACGPDVPCGKTWGVAVGCGDTCEPLVGIGAFDSTRAIGDGVNAPGVFARSGRGARDAGADTLVVGAVPSLEGREGAVPYPGGRPLCTLEMPAELGRRGGAGPTAPGEGDGCGLACAGAPFVGAGADDPLRAGGTGGGV